MRNLICFLLLFVAIQAGAQTVRYDTVRISNSIKKDNAGTLVDRKNLRFGADFGLSISNNYTNLGIGPQIGYQFNQYFMTGLGVKYYYSRTRTYEYIVKNHLLGANFFGYLYPVKFFTIFVQPEFNYIWSSLVSRGTGNEISDKGFVPSLVTGAGLRIRRSHITLNYDLLQQDNSPHPDGLYLGVSAFF